MKSSAKMFMSLTLTVAVTVVLIGCGGSANNDTTGRTGAIMSPSYPLPPELPNAFNVVPIQLTPDPLPESKDEGFVPSTQFLVSIDGRLVPGDQLNVVFQPGADSDVIEALLAQEKLTRVYWSVKGDSASYQVVVLPEGASVVTVASTLRQNPLVKSIDYIALIFAD